MIVRTLNEYGEAVCPMCDIAVEIEGAFCGPSHWQWFHELVFEMGVVIEMDYLDLEEQPWYAKHHG